MANSRRKAKRDRQVMAYLVASVQKIAEAQGVELDPVPGGARQTGILDTTRQGRRRLKQPAAEGEAEQITQEERDQAAREVIPTPDNESIITAQAGDQNERTYTQEQLDAAARAVPTGDQIDLEDGVNDTEAKTAGRTLRQRQTETAQATEKKGTPKAAGRSEKSTAKTTVEKSRPKGANT